MEGELMAKNYKDNKPIKMTAKQLFIRHNRRWHHSQEYDDSIRENGEKVAKACRKLGISRDMQCRIGTMKLYQMLTAEGIIK